MIGEEISIFNDGYSFVRLVEVGGSELSIVNAARVSLHNESEWDDEIKRVLKGSDAGLINFLMREKHGSPFEHNFFAFHIRLPIFVMREWVRHRIGFSINEESGRYVEMRPHFFIPDHVRTQHGKPGAYTFEVSEDKFLTDEFISRLSAHSEESYHHYQWALNNGIAKEQARLFLPLNLYTECRWTANARSLMNFLALRNESHAMKEIRDYAIAVEKHFNDEMPNVREAFINNGRIAP